jgi:signal transduction histidine kinase
VSVRLRFALLYAGALLISGLMVLALAFFTTSSVKQVGSAGPATVNHPVEESLGPIADVVAALLVLVLLSVAFGWLLAGRLLRPVRLITSTARDISASNLSRRLRTGSSRRGDEFARLGETLNELFARLEASFQAQRHFVANASHELRTPLTAERTVLQVALADPDADTAALRAACEQVLALGARTERLIDALLTLATGERGIERMEPLDLAGLAERVVETRGQAARQRGVRLVATLDPAPAMGDPRLAESLIANLADNALRYNGPGGWAELTTATRAGRAVVSVRNTGQRIPPEEVSRLFQPFERLDGERGHHPAGHGLGLAIVRAIADAHGAVITATARDDGGLDVAVTFPPHELLGQQGEVMSELASESVSTARPRMRTPSASEVSS